MRTLWIPMLAAGCATVDPAPVDPNGAEALAKGGVEVALSYACVADGACDTLLVGLVDRDEAEWWIDGKEVGWASDVEVDVPDKVPVVVTAATDDGGHADAWIQPPALEDDGSGVIDGSVIILGNQGSCGLFRITAVSGCLVAPQLEFSGQRLPAATAVAPVRFSVNPPAIGALGYAFAAKWPGGSLTTAGIPNGWSGGFDHWFAIPSGQTYDLVGYHVNNGVRSNAVRLPFASCVGDTPVITGGQ